MVSEHATGGAGGFTDEYQRIRDLEREVCELRSSNDMLRRASALLCEGGGRLSVENIISLLEKFRGESTGSDRYAMSWLSPRQRIHCPEKRSDRVST